MSDLTDPARLCFMWSDPELYINPKRSELTVARAGETESNSG